MNTESETAVGTLLEWPIDGLQVLGCCPLCQDTKRTLLHEGLEDRLFHCAPGKWTMFGCGGCGLAYLDPRPNRATIGIAYKSYFTHHDRVDDDPANRGAGLLRRLKQLVTRQYIRMKFGNQQQRLFWMFGCLLYLRPRQRAAFDGAMRHLPRPEFGQKLLDIGCGNGRFMAWARVAGWVCTGTEIDPSAANRARARGFRVHTGELEELVATGELFHAITISHVIEHVHDPRALLLAARQLLAPGGVLWIETPNIKSHGYKRFGSAWRGVEPPRHLQLFNHDLLNKLLLQAGFCDVRHAPWQPDWEVTFPESLRLATLQGQMVGQRHKFSLKEEVVGRQRPEQREFITFLASPSVVLSN